jgi:hypothetical protein
VEDSKERHRQTSTAFRSLSHLNEHYPWSFEVSHNHLSAVHFSIHTVTEGSHNGRRRCDPRSDSPSY